MNEEERRVEKIREMADALADECEVQGIPCVVAYGLDRVVVTEYAPDNTPDVIKRAHDVLFNSTKRVRRSMEVG
jgi:hypothetical protein